MSGTILRAEELVQVYPVRGTRQTLTAVAGVSLDLHRGETLGVVGFGTHLPTSIARGERSHVQPAFLRNPFFFAAFFRV